MGFLRGGLTIVFGILLFFSLLTMNSFFALSSSLGYENVQDELPSIITEFTEQPGIFGLPENVTEDFNLSEVTGQALEVLEKHCVNNTDYVFSYEGYTIDVPCSAVADGEDAVIDETIGDVVEDTYYDDYDCGFFECLSETGAPFFLVSEKAKNFWERNLYIGLVVSLIILALLFFFMERRENFPIVVGSLIILSSLPLIKIDDLFSVFGPPISLFTGLFFSNAGSIFWLMFILGLIVLIIGIALRFLKPDFLKTKFSKKDVKRIVKKEAGKAK